MPTVSDYAIVANSHKTLQQPAGDRDVTYDFTLPSNLNQRGRAVATWLFDTDSLPNGLRYHVLINGTELTDYTHSGVDMFATIQEVFSASVLKAGTNEALVEIIGGTGRIQVSSFVVHFQVDV